MKGLNMPSVGDDSHETSQQRPVGVGYSLVVETVRAIPQINYQQLDQCALFPKEFLKISYSNDFYERETFLCSFFLNPR